MSHVPPSSLRTVRDDLSTERGETAHSPRIATIGDAWTDIIADLARAEPRLAAKIRMWLNPNHVRPAACADGVLDLECQTNLYQTQIRTHLAEALIASASRIMGTAITQVRCRVSRAAAQDHAERIERARAADAEHAPSSLPTGFGIGYKTLAEFVVGSCNRLAYTAIVSLLDNPRTSASPLFIHGASGLGKTHLEQGLALAFKERYPKAHVLYVRCEQFTNEFLEACADPKHALRAFRIKMRHPDLLLIDDIHWLGQGMKAKTKDELLATLEALNEQGKRVVITSDACPRDIKYLEERLVQRFSAGLVVSLDRPDPQVRRDILSSRAALSGLDIPQPVLSWLTDRFTDNMRQLEGAIHKLVAFSRSFDRPIDLAAARIALADLIQGQADESASDLVLREVAERFSVHVRDLRGRGRSRPVSTARQIALYILKHVTNDTYSAVGRQLGVRSHASVAQACERAVTLRAADTALDAFIEDLVFRARRCPAPATGR